MWIKTKDGVLLNLALVESIQVTETPDGGSKIEPAIGEYRAKADADEAYEFIVDRLDKTDGLIDLTSIKVTQARKRQIEEQTKLKPGQSIDQRVFGEDP